MGYLEGLQEYLDQFYQLSVFDEALNSKRPWEFHLHDHRIVTAKILENLKYDIRLNAEGSGEEVVPKIHVKFLCQEEMAGSVKPFLKVNKEVQQLALKPIFSPSKRNHIKNKSLFPLMKERQVVFLTLLEGDIMRGIIAGFTRYEITLHLKGGTPVTVLRHSIYDMRDKKGRCFLKSFQETHRDWERSPLYKETSPEA